MKNFFQPKAAEPTEASVDSKSGERLSLTSLVDINFLHECTFPITLNLSSSILPRWARDHLPEGAKYQILTRRDYFSNAFKFPPNHGTPPRQCYLQVLNQNDFLRYSPSLDGVFCVHCVLFSNKLTNVKFHSVPERDWSNVHKTAQNHTKIPAKKNNLSMYCAFNGLLISYSISKVEEFQCCIS